VLSALRGVAREAWRLGQVDAETHARIRDVQGVRGSRLPAGREVPMRELAKLFRACAQARARLRQQTGLSPSQSQVIRMLIERGLAALEAEASSPRKR